MQVLPIVRQEVLAVVDRIAEMPFHALSRTLHYDAQAKVAIFGFAPGHEVKAGASAHMPPQLRHGIPSGGPAIVFLTMHQRAPGRKRQWSGNGPQSAHRSVCGELIC